MNTKFLNLSTLMMAAMLLGACASAPTWEGMSETEIAAWKQLNVGPGDAQDYRKAGLDQKAVAPWMDHGFKTAKSVLAWHKAGFSAEEANAWSTNGFTLDNAVAWKKEKFKPDEALAWRKAGFSLDDSVENREKGLTPIEK